MANRPRGKPFQKGHVGMGGRPKGARGFARMVREQTNGGVEMFRELKRIMKKGDKDADRVNAAKCLISYAFGNPIQRTELTGAKGGAIQIKNMTDEELRKYVDDLSTDPAVRDWLGRTEPAGTNGKTNGQP